MRHQLREPGDLLLALGPRRVVSGHALALGGEAIEDAEREGRRRRPRERADAVDRALAAAEPVGTFALAHRFRSPVFGVSCSGVPGAGPSIESPWPDLTGATSAISSSSTWRS